MKKTIIVLISLIFAIALMSGGYGKWQRDLVIEGDIELVADPEVIENLELDLKELQEKLVELEELKLAEELEEKDNEELEQNKKDLKVEIDHDSDTEDNNTEYSDEIGPEIPSIDDVDDTGN